MKGRPMQLPPGARRLVSAATAATVPTVVLALACTAALVVPGPAAAQGQEPFGLRFQAIDRGGIAVVGNTVLSCDDSPACSDVQQGLVDGMNDDFPMVWVDVDADPATFNSSTATVVVPDGGDVLHARLVWGAEIAAGPGGAPPPDADARGTVRLSTPVTGGYVDVAAERLDGIGVAFQGVADVTDLVRAGGSGSYTVADVQAATGTGRAGGWVLIVVARDPSQPVRSLTVFDGFQLLQTGDVTDIVISGFVTPPIGPVNAELGALGWEGDRGLTGDSLQLDGTPLVNDLNPPDDAFNSTMSDDGVPVTDRVPAHDNLLGVDADVFDATGLIGTSATSATVRIETTGDFFRPGVITAAIEMSVPDLATEAAKIFTDMNGGPVLVGDELEFTVRSTNTGNDAAVDTVVTDELPAGLDYVPGSLVVDGVPASDGPGDDTGEIDSDGRTVIARVGVGADATTGGALEPGAPFTVTFRATVDGAALGERVRNTASLSFLGRTLGDATRFDVDISPETAAFDVVAGADLSVTKTSDRAFYTAGQPLTFTIGVANAGPSAVTDARLVDAVSGVLDDATWTCEVVAGTGACSAPTGTGDVDVALDLAVGALARAVVTGRVGADVTGAIENTATVTAPGGVVDPDPSDNSASHRTEGQPVADLSLRKRFVGDRLEPGRTADFEIVVRNDGPDAVTGATVEDRPGAGTTVVDWRCREGSPPGCTTSHAAGPPTALVDLGPGEEVVLLLTVSIDPRVDIQLTNLALVRPPEGVIDPDASDDSVLVAGSVVPNEPPRLIRPIIVESDGQRIITIDPREYASDPEGHLDPAGSTVTIDPAVGSATVDPVTGVITIVLSDEVLSRSPIAGGGGPSEVSFGIELCDLRGGCITVTATIRLGQIIPATGGEPLPTLIAGLLLIAFGTMAVGAANGDRPPSSAGRVRM